MAEERAGALPPSLRQAVGRLKARVRLYLESPTVAVKLRAALLRPYRRLRFQSFGTGSIVHRPEWLAGAHRIAIGDDVAILGRCWLAAEPQSWRRPGPALSIGDRAAIGAFCMITAVESVVLEEDVSVASFSFITDVHHSVGAEQVVDRRRPGLRAINRNATLVAPIETTPVRIGRGTWIGKGATVLRGSDIGIFCAIGANSVVRGHIPDYSVAVGAPARVVGSTR